MAGRDRRKTDEHWIKDHWRPLMAWQYFAVCLFDFLVGPVLNGIFHYYANQPLVPWTPLTLQGGGLYHVAMGAIIGITSWGRTKEKMSINENPANIPAAPASEDPEI
jgi:hypothetical protein